MSFLRDIIDIFNNNYTYKKENAKKAINIIINKIDTVKSEDGIWIVRGYKNYEHGMNEQAIRAFREALKNYILPDTQTLADDKHKYADNLSFTLLGLVLTYSAMARFDQAKEYLIILHNINPDMAEKFKEIWKNYPLEEKSVRTPIEFINIINKLFSLFRPKKVNKGFDRIFLVVALIAAVLFGFYVGIEESNSVTYESYRGFVGLVLIEEFMDSPEKEKEESMAKKEKEQFKASAKPSSDKFYEESNKVYPLAHKRFMERKQRLEREGYRLTFLDWYNKELVVTTDLNAPWISIRPPISRCIAIGVLFGLLSFLIVLFSLRGLILLVFWIKEGFNENELN